MIEQPFITIKDYSDKYGVSVKTVHNWIKNGRIPKEKIKKVLNVTLVKG